MFKHYVIKLLIVGASSFLMLASYARSPLWVFSAPTPAMLSVGQNEKSTIKYTVTNQSSEQKHLYLKNIDGISAGPCYLEGKGSTCTLTLFVNGGKIPVGGIHAGPVLCDQSLPNQCYQPAANNLLRINKKNTSSEPEKYWSVIGFLLNEAGYIPNKHQNAKF